MAQIRTMTGQPTPYPIPPGQKEGFSKALLRETKMVNKPLVRPAISAEGALPAPLISLVHMVGLQPGAMPPTESLNDVQGTNLLSRFHPKKGCKLPFLYHITLRAILIERMNGTD